MNALYRGRPIISRNICPPVPSREYDWTAYLDGDDETGPFGFGATEEAALRDLLYELAMEEEGDDGTYHL